jgi:opacity protein-like surface antigen
MFRPFPRLRALFLATLLCAGAAAQARAADMPGLADLALPTPPDEPVEWGSNWYLRGDVALERARVPALSGDFAALLNSDTLVGGGVGGGYQFNEWLRADVTLDRSAFKRSGVLNNQVWCPYQMVGLVDQKTGYKIGIFANPLDTCSQWGSASLTRTSGLANVYLDIFHFWGLTPYVGAGVGLTYNSGSAGVAYFRNNGGGMWTPDLTLPDGQVPKWIYANGATYPIQLPFGPTNWNSWTTRSSWQLAWNLMAGVSYDVSQNLKIDVGYRYLNAGRYTGLAAWGTFAVPASREITSQELRVGVRVLSN